MTNQPDDTVCPFTQQPQETCERIDLDRDHLEWHASYARSLGLAPSDTKRSECEWCGVDEPVFFNLLEDVIQFEDGAYHTSCKATADAYAKVRDAIAALPKGEAAELEDLIREDLRNKIEKDAE
jgi:hypothetical protein